MNIKDHYILGLNQADTMEEMAQAVFSAITAHVPSYSVTVLFHPLQIDLPIHYNRPELKNVIDIYQTSDLTKLDIWVDRSPRDPKTEFARHSDYTPKETLLNSNWYDKILKPHQLMYGTGLLSWEGNQCLAWINCVRKEKEGDFTNKELETISKIQPHIENAIRRLAASEEAVLGKRALEIMIKSIPVATLILNWDLDVYLKNDKAVELCRYWNRRTTKISDAISELNVWRFPSDLKWSLEALKKDLQKQLYSRQVFREETLKRRINVAGAQEKGLIASIDFLPSRTLSFSRGYFIVRLEKESSEGFKREVNPYQKLSQLSEAERYIAELVAKGFTNQEIALELGKSRATIRNQLHSIFIKLGVKKRQEVISLLR